jgi:hypothetical protein
MTHANDIGAKTEMTLGITAHVTAIAVPTLVVVGDADRVGIEETFRRRVNRHITSAEFLVLSAIDARGSSTRRGASESTSCSVGPPGLDGDLRVAMAVGHWPWDDPANRTVTSKAASARCRQVEWLRLVKLTCSRVACRTVRARTTSDEAQDSWTLDQHQLLEHFA